MGQIKCQRTKVGSTYTSEAHFVTKMMETTNTILSILKIVVLDEAEAGSFDQKKNIEAMNHLPFAKIGLMVNDGLG